MSPTVIYAFITAVLASIGGTAYMSSQPVQSNDSHQVEVIRGTGSTRSGNNNEG